MDDRAHILVPTNFRQHSRARQRALQLALEIHAKVTLLHVSQPLIDATRAADLNAVALLHAVVDDFGKSLSQSQLSTRRMLQNLADGLHPEWRQLVNVHVAWRQGAILGSILKFTREEKVNTIVVGARRSRWSWLLPSLADRLLQKAQCEVILVCEERQAIQDQAVSNSMT